jgi:hypothetical protein
MVCLAGMYRYSSLIDDSDGNSGPNISPYWDVSVGEEGSCEGNQVHRSE